MAGIHKYSSSLFIQSGAVAQFKSGISASGINVEGTINASGYFNLAGEEITSGDPSVFFAGIPGDSTTGISRSAANGGPISVDTFIEMGSTNTTGDVLNEGLIRIETTGSSTFKPNFFNFLKIGNLDANIVTVQQGGLNSSSYIPDSEEERSAGVHKYIIYAAETGSAGETHQVFHTVTLQQFLNNPPTLEPPNDTVFTKQLDHDENSKDTILDFSDSFDVDQQEGQGNDFLKFFTGSRTSTDPTIGANDASYNITLNHNATTEQTIGGNPSIGLFSDTPGLAKAFRSTNKSILGLTASLTNYKTVDNDGNNQILTIQTQTENFSVTIKDSFTGATDEGIVTQTYNLNISKPPNATLDEPKVFFEGGDNDGGFKNSTSTTHTHTVLYDFTGSLDSSSIALLNKRYTSSIIRIQPTIQITEPNGYNALPDHFTFLRIQSSSNSTIDVNSPTLGYFRINGIGTVGTTRGIASAFAENSIDGTYNTLSSLSEKDDFKTIQVKFDGNNTSTISRTFGLTTDNNLINNINYVQHGDNDHFIATEGNSSTGVLTLNKCPNIVIDNIKVEVETGSIFNKNPDSFIVKEFGTGNFKNQLTSSLLYGLTSSLSSSQTGSYFGNFINTPFYNTYLSQSLVRFRVKAKIIEPFGPSHNPISASIQSTQPLSSGTGIPIISNGGNLTPITTGTSTGVTNFTEGTTGTAILDLGDQNDNYDFTGKIKLTKVELTGDISDFGEVFTNLIIGGETIITNAFEPTTGDDNIDTVFPADQQTAGVSGVTINSTLNDSNITITDGIVNVQVTYGANINKDKPIKIIAHFVTIDQPYTSQLFEFSTSSIYTNGSNYGYTTNHNYETLTGNNVFNDKELLVSQYTSSWQEVRIPQGTHEFKAFFTSQSNAGTTLENSTSQSSTVSMSVAPATRYENLNYETETFGYSGIGTTESMRTVLYGDAHFTNNGTGSNEDGEGFSSHENADTYASHSVSRFRISGKIIEPLGIGLTNTTITLKAGNNISSNILLNKSIAGTPSLPSLTSTNLSTSNLSYDSNGTLVTIFTSSFLGKKLTLSTNFVNEVFRISSSISPSFNTSNTIVAAADNGVEIIPETNQGNITVRDTEKIKITNVRYETETFGYSGIVAPSNPIPFRQVLYGYSHKSIEGTGSGETGEGFNTLGDRGINYASQSVTRFRVKADIKEPLGPLHEPLVLTQKWNHSVIDNNLTTVDISLNVTNNKTFETGSGVVSSGYNEHRLLTSSYTQSFEGRILSVKPRRTASYQFNGEWSGFNSNEQLSADITNVATNTPILIFDTQKTKISVKNIFIESFGESNIVTSNNSNEGSIPASHTRTILSGETKTRGTGSNLNDNVTGSSVLRTQYSEVNIVEPLGPLHHGTSMSVFFDNTSGTGDQIGTPTLFVSNSGTGESDDMSSISPTYASGIGKLSTLYTSKLTGSLIEASNPNAYKLTINSNNVIHAPTGENDFDIISFPDDNFINVQPSSSNNIISNLKIKIETTSGSGTEFATGGTQLTERTTNILHGNTGSEVNPSINNQHPNSTSRNQLVSARVLASIQQPVGVNHLDTIIKIGGHSKVKSIIFNSGSQNSPSTNTQVSSSIVPASLGTGLLTHYTSSFFPLHFIASSNTSTDNTVSNAEKITFTISASVDNINNDSSIPFVVNQASNTIPIHVTGALSSSVNGIIETGSSPFLSSSIFKSGEEKSLYFLFSDSTATFMNNFTTKTIQLFPNITTIAPTFTTESNLKFPNNLNISHELTKPSSLNSTTLTSQTTGTASIKIFESQLDDLTSVERLDLTTTITNTEEGNGGAIISKSIFVIPAPPRNMEGSFATQFFAAHPTEMQDKFFKGSLVSESLVHYSESTAANLNGVGPRNPGFPSNPPVSFEVTSSRIIFTSQSNGTHNYNITLNTHGSTVSNTGNQFDNTRAYAYGDLGTLEVKLNDVSIKIASLEDNFQTSNKGGSQVTSNYNAGGFTGGTASLFVGDNAIGNFHLRSIGVFNGVSQSISSSFGLGLPNGYQGWSAVVNITDKPRSGYNKLDFIHNISQNLTQSLNVFDWNYNDGIESASIASNENFSYVEEPNNPATHSISGVSYFRNNTTFTASLNNILNLANKVYPSKDNTQKEAFFTKKNSNLLEVIGDGQTLSNTNSNLLHNFTDLKGIETTYQFFNRRGLRFHTGSQFGETTGPHQTNYIPTAESTASLKLRLRTTSLPTNDSIDNILGFIPELSGFTRQYNKKSETATTDRELYTKKVGRFMYSASALGNFEASTDQIENFHNEDLRWASASIENIIANSRSDYTFFLTSSNANYNSIQSILSTNDLQQVYSGSLRYPSGDYSGVTLPNSVNYTNAAANTANGSGDRFYYRAFKLPSFSEGTLRFRLKVFGKFTQSDIFALGLNNSNIRIDIRLPGPFNDPFDNLGNGATEGSFYGVVNNQFSGIDTTGGSNGNVPWCAYISRNLTSTDPTLNDGIEFVVSTREVFVFNTDGVIIVKIRYKSGFTGYISKIQILNN